MCSMYILCVYASELHAGCGPTFLIGPRAENLVRTPRDDNRDNVFNCHEVPIKEYLRKWNFVSFHLFVFAETHSHKRIP